MSPLRRCLACFALVALAAVLPANAQYSETVSGSLVPGGPTIPRVGIISTPNCTGAYVEFAALFAAYPLAVGADGTYNVDEPGTESAVYVLEGSFDPEAVAATCIAASNTNPISLDVSLTAGTQYFLVVIEDTFTQDGMDYALTVSGPGSVAFSIPTPLAIPTLSTWSLGLLSLLLAAAGFVALRRRLAA